MKHLNYASFIVCACFITSCTLAVYVQKNNSDSTQKVENPTSASVDSTTITIQSPIK